MREKELEIIFKSLANKRRIIILGYLKRKDRVSVSDIASEIKLSLKSTSKHLIILTHAGIVEKEQVSLTVFYSLSKNQHLVITKLLSVI